MLKFQSSRDVFLEFFLSGFQEIITGKIISQYWDLAKHQQPNIIVCESRDNIMGNVMKISSKIVSTVKADKSLIATGFLSESLEFFLRYSLKEVLG